MSDFGSFGLNIGRRWFLPFCIPNGTPLASRFIWENRAFLQRCCPDGEGKWSAEADPALSQSLRVKGAFSEGFIEHCLRVIQKLSQTKQFVLLALGGRMTPDNQRLLSQSTDFIVLSSSKVELENWYTFGTQAGCRCLALLESVLIRNAEHRLDMTAQSRLESNTRPLRGRFVNLDRDVSSICYQAEIASLADYLITVVNDDEV